MEAFLVSLGAIFIGEIGDKTQLLALLLAARFKRPIPIILGILVATVSNHIVAALIGHWVATHFSPEFLRWILGLSFIAIAAWTLKPDEIDNKKIDHAEFGEFGIFTITVFSFFLAEVGDKTQIATMAIAAKYPNIYMVVAGSTLGMMLADVPAVFLGNKATTNFPFKWIRWGAAFIFTALGCVVLVGFDVDLF